MANITPMLSYLDPGTGSMIAAALAGGVAGLGVFFKMYWHRFAGVFSRKHRAAAAANLSAEAATAALRGIDHPLSKLVAIGVLFQAGRASPTTIALAVETASAQGWRRPLLGWLNVQLALAEKAGDAGETARLRRRIGVVQGDK